MPLEMKEEQKEGHLPKAGEERRMKVKEQGEEDSMESPME
jgi:hypothetical protein